MPRMDEKTPATSVENTDIVILGHPTTGTMKKATIQQVAPKNTETNLTDAATVSWNFNNGNIAKVTLGGNRTLSISNVPARSSGLLIVTQDATGGRTLALPGIFPSEWELSEDGNAVDMLGFYYDGTNYYWAVPTPGTGGGGSTPVEEDINFATVVGISNAAGVWSSTGTDYSNSYGLADKKLAAGQDGYIQFRFQASDGGSALLAFSLTNTNKPYDGPPIDGTPPLHYHAAVWVFNGNVFKIDNTAAAVDSGVDVVVGDYLRIIRTGSEVKLQKSSNGTTWADAHTFTFTSTADLFINININGSPNKLYLPRGYNLTAV